MQAALTQATEDPYHNLETNAHSQGATGHARELKELHDDRARRQQDFNNQFLSVLHQHEMIKHTNFLEVGHACALEDRASCVINTG